MCATIVVKLNAFFVKSQRYEGKSIVKIEKSEVDFLYKKYIFSNEKIKFIFISN